MVDEKYAELINREIDHVNSPKQSKKLQEYLKNHPEAQKLYNDLSNISKILSQTKFVDPPENLKKNIISAIPVDRYKANAKKIGLIHYFNTFLFEGKPRFAYAFSGGVLTGIIVILLVLSVLGKNNLINFSNLRGTIGANSSTPIFHAVENLDMDGANLKGNIELSCSDNSVLIKLSLKTPNDVNVIIEFNENEMNILEFKKSNNLGNELIVDKHSLQFSNIGENNYQIVFARKTAALLPFSLKIDSAATILFEHFFLGSMGDGKKY